jgi:hypothetical protein
VAGDAADFLPVAISFSLGRFAVGTLS